MIDPPKPRFLSNKTGRPTPSGPRSRIIDLDRVFAHLFRDVVRLTNGKRNNRQGGVLCAAGRELAAIGDEQILDVVSLAEFVADAISRILRHPAGAEIMR